MICAISGHKFVPTGDFLFCEKCGETRELHVKVQKADWHTEGEVLLPDILEKKIKEADNLDDILQ